MVEEEGGQADTIWQRSGERYCSPHVTVEIGSVGGGGGGHPVFDAYALASVAIDILVHAGPKG